MSPDSGAWYPFELNRRHHVDDEQMGCFQREQPICYFSGADSNGCCASKGCRPVAGCMVFVWMKPSRAVSLPVFACVLVPAAWRTLLLGGCWRLVDAAAWRTLLLGGCCCLVGAAAWWVLLLGGGWSLVVAGAWWWLPLGGCWRLVVAGAWRVLPLAKDLFAPYRVTRQKIGIDSLTISTRPSQ
ncbi:hypothetical protein [Alicyclobacillus sp. SO9]|uniref:hypothetical protein n=1 Tax=Alicyclobacillus sp. SO9 TaxID=2665646 RepID=UPI0018E70191|nr:hypothetical protein [Alicyclobacillus sp. SO9]QQE80570.1 hypothetical protein GI364_09260 [Alicyclobacillus sp. SO9]